MRYFGAFLLGVFLLCSPAISFATDYSGVVWKRHGDWHLNGSSSVLRLGESISSGGLISADGAGAHSLVILMPDGQRLLCECYEAATCAQGFRVPGITSPPSAPVWAAFVAVRSALLMRPATAEEPFAPPVGREEGAGIVETVGAMDAGEVTLAPALRVLPVGRYRLQVHGDGPQSGTVTTPAVQPLDWNPARAVARVRVPGLGLYRVTVIDETNVPRMEIELLATPAAAVASETDGLRQMRSTVIEWNRTHEGWSLHDYLRVYLQSRSIALPQ